jgi:hypothetical protein
VGAQRWCDGQTFCSWGKQTCELVGGTARWGTCVEGDPRHPPNPAPDTSCACYYPYSYNPQCCENPQTCIVMGQRNVPCGTVNGGALCSPCGDDTNCPGGACIFNPRRVQDWPNGGGTMTAMEQFCSHTCNTAGDCGAGYNCIQPSGSPSRYCVPSAGSCVR